MRVTSFPADGCGVLQCGYRLVKSVRQTQGGAEVVESTAFIVPLAYLPEDGDGALTRSNGQIKLPHSPRTTAS